MRLLLGYEEVCPICKMKLKYLAGAAIVTTVYGAEHCGNEQLHTNICIEELST